MITAIINNKVKVQLDIDSLMETLKVYKRDPSTIKPNVVYMCDNKILDIPYIITLLEFLIFMTQEEMLELLCLTNFLSREQENCKISSYYSKVLHNYINMDMMENRRSELEQKLLNPYVIKH